VEERELKNLQGGGGEGRKEEGVEAHQDKLTTDETIKWIFTGGP
jgi:hypothetical protein